MKRETKNKLSKRVCQNPYCEAEFIPKYPLEAFCKACNDKLILWGIKPLHLLNKPPKDL